MSQIWNGDMETGNFSQYSSQNQAVLESVVVRNGSYAFRIITASSSTRSTTGFGASTLYTRVSFRWSASPGSGNETELHSFRSGSDARVITLYFGADGTGPYIYLWNHVTASRIGSTYYLPQSPGTWITVEVKGVRSSSAGVGEVRINGTVRITGSGLNTGSANFDRVSFVNFLSTFTAYFDDAAADNTAYPGEPGGVTPKSVSDTLAIPGPPEVLEAGAVLATFSKADSFGAGLSDVGAQSFGVTPAEAVGVRLTESGAVVPTLSTRADAFRAGIVEQALVESIGVPVASSESLAAGMGEASDVLKVTPTPVAASDGLAVALDEAAIPGAVEHAAAENPEVGLQESSQLSVVKDVVDSFDVALTDPTPTAVINVLQWPATLPPVPLYDGFSESPPEEVIRTQMDAGVAQQRRRSAAGARPIRARLGLTAAQTQVLDDFYVTGCAAGSLRFQWTHPRTGAAVLMRFTAPPIFTARAKDAWYAEVELEVIL